MLATVNPCVRTHPVDEDAGGLDAARLGRPREGVVAQLPARRLRPGGEARQQEQRGRRPRPRRHGDHFAGEMLLCN